MSRLRVIAGPNGSGKSSVFNIIKDFKEQGKGIQTGPFINSDLIEKEFREKGFIALKNYGIKEPQSTIIQDYLTISTLKTPYDPSIIKDLVFLDEGNFKLRGKESSPYLGMVVSDLIREELLKRELSFTMETVFSHMDKVQFMQRAKEAGYKVYLYFVSTESPEINIRRVVGRVQEGGHDVPHDKIVQRYFRTMQHLVPALRLAYRAYLFDNSGSETIKVAEKHKDGSITLSETVPTWIAKYLLPNT